MDFLTLFAEATSGAREVEDAGLFQALGLDIKQLLINTAAFLILLWILSKFVYPTLIKSIDDRRATIEASLEQAKHAQKASEDAEKRVEELLVKARKEADEIIARSHTEATSMISDAEAKAKQRSEQIVKDARGQLEADVIKARTALKKDTMKLVAMATERVVGERLNIDNATDVELVERAIKASSNAAGVRL